MRLGRILTLCAAVLAAACHGDSSQTPLASVAPRPNAPLPVRRGPTPDELTAGMVEAVTTSKSTVPVALKFELPRRPVVGEPIEVTVAVMPQISANSAVLEANGSDGLRLAPGGGAIEMPSVEPTQVYRHEIGLTPAAEGVQLLALRVSLTHDDVTETREFSVPFIVAPAADATLAAKR